MKSKLTLTIALLTACILPLEAQTNADYSTYAATSETPPTTRMRVENAQRRHTESILELTTTLNRIPNAPELISSKEAIDAIDSADRAMKRTKTACASIMVALKTEAASIQKDTSFSDTQKSELLDAIESMKTECNGLTEQADATIKHLSVAYQEMRKWRRVYNTYQNLEGAGKANQHLKTAVDAYVKILTDKPATTAKMSPTDTNDSPKSGLE